MPLLIGPASLGIVCGVSLAASGLATHRMCRNVQREELQDRRCGCWQGLRTVAKRLRQALNNAVTRTFVRVADGQSRDLRNAFLAGALRVVRPGRERRFHTHAQAASNRCAATTSVTEFCRDQGRERYDYQYSSREEKFIVAGERDYFTTGDAHQIAYADPALRDNSLVTMIDVDYRMSVSQFSQFAGRDMLLYTIVPNSLGGRDQGNTSDYMITQDGDWVESVSGGAIYQHPLYDWNIDVVKINTWFSRYIYNVNLLADPSCRRKAFVLLTPKSRVFCPWIFDWLYSLLDDVKPIQPFTVQTVGNYYFRVFKTAYGNFVDIVANGDSTVNRVSAELFNAVLSRKRTKEKVSTQMVEKLVRELRGFQPVPPNRTAPSPLLGSYFNRQPYNGVEPEEYKEFADTCAGVVHMACMFADDVPLPRATAFLKIPEAPRQAINRRAEDGDSGEGGDGDEPTGGDADEGEPVLDYNVGEFENKTVQLAEPMLSEQGIAPVEGEANTRACIQGRVEKVANNVTPPSHVVKYRDEFIRCMMQVCKIRGKWDALTPQKGGIHPADENDVAANQNRPTQRARRDERSRFTRASQRKEFRSFQKKETYAKTTDPRNITTCPIDHTVDLSCFTYALKDRLREFGVAWYTPGNNPQQMAEAITNYVSKKEAVIETDFSRFDGTVSKFMREMECEVFIKFFDKRYASKITELCTNEWNAKITAQHRVKYKAGYSRLSGSPLTTIMNTILNAFFEYCCLRESGFGCKAAFRNIGPKYGDDGVNHRQGAESIAKVAGELGLSVKHEIKRRGGPVCFCSRFYVDPWSTKTSYTAMKPALLKIPVSASGTTKLSDRVFGYLATDPQTPLLSNYLRYLQRRYKLDEKAEVTDRDMLYRISEGPYPYAKEDDKLVVESIAVELGCDPRIIWEACEELERDVLNPITVEGVPVPMGTYYLLQPGQTQL